MPAEHGARILVVDDHVEMARLLADQLRDLGYQVEVAGGGRAALEQAERALPDVVITDLRMEGADGFDVLAGIHRLDPGIPVLLMTAFGAIDTAIEAMRLGAFHYLTKPFRLDEVQVFVERAVDSRRQRDAHLALQRLTGDRARLEGMIGTSAAMASLSTLVERVAQASAPVLVRGESGSGKELVARAIHFSGPRRDRPFVALNCTALPETLLESELFGHHKGAFTGAASARRGLFVEADGGSLFLDEIGDMPLELQAKLLRVLERGEIRAVGADSERRVDVRIIAATHQDLEARVGEQRFRADLFYRLNVVPVTVPPLRQRSDDIPQLVDHFVARARQANPGSSVRGLKPEVLDAMLAYAWPGNVRELENLVTRLVIVCAGEQVENKDLAQHAPALLEDCFSVLRPRSQLVPLKQVQAEYIAWVIRQCGGNKTRAAEILGIDVSTIHRRERGER
ncbi:MAG: sigma-54 dependent transcriptional regulator [Pseudomonadota bacterium]